MTLAEITEVSMMRKRFPEEVADDLSLERS